MTSGARCDLRNPPPRYAQVLSEIEAAAWARSKVLHFGAGDASTVLAELTLS